MQFDTSRTVTRRRLCAAVGASIASAGCSADSSKSPGSVVESIEIINVDETPHQFQVALSTASGTRLFERTVTVDSAPGNTYIQTDLTDVPATPAARIAVTTENQSAEREIPDGLDDPVYTVLCNPAGELGIARFTETLEFGR